MATASFLGFVATIYGVVAQYERIEDYSLYQSSGWTPSPTRIDWLDGNDAECEALGGTPCLQLGGGGYASKILDTRGYHSLRIEIDVKSRGLDDPDECCYLEYSTPGNNPHVINFVCDIGATTTQLDLQYSLDNSADDDKDLRLQLGNNANLGSDYCWFDNFLIEGILITPSPSKTPTKDPTRTPSDSPTNPTNTPTSDPTTDYPTASPSNNPSNVPTNNPTSSRTPTKDPTTGYPTASPSKGPAETPSDTPTVISTTTSPSLNDHISAHEPTYTPTIAEGEAIDETWDNSERDQETESTPIWMNPMYLVIVSIGVLIVCIICIIFGYSRIKRRNKTLEMETERCISVSSADISDNAIQSTHVQINSMEGSVEAMYDDAIVTEGADQIDEKESESMYNTGNINEDNIMTSNGLNTPNMNRNQSSIAASRAASLMYSKEEMYTTKGAEDTTSKGAINIKRQESIERLFDKQNNDKVTPTTQSRGGYQRDRDYNNWDYEDVLHWILSIDDGYFKSYRELLHYQFKLENFAGSYLTDVQKNDIKGWGIHDFGHRQKLFNAIQELINNNEIKHMDTSGFIQ